MHIASHFSVRSTARTLLLLALLGLGTTARADFFNDIYEGIFGEDEQKQVPTAEGAATTATSEDSEPEPFRQTLSDARLTDIVEKQEELFAEIENKPERRNDLEYQRRLRAIATQYDSFLLDNPDYVYGYLLYGKFLRRTGQSDLANNAFMKANMLDPNIAVAKQQIGNYLAEEGEYTLALAYYLSAIELEPDEPLYHYDLGILLSHYRTQFIESGTFDPDTLDRSMLKTFRDASDLDPANRDYHIRFAEAFFEVDNPDWQDALNQWTILSKGIDDPLQLELVQLQKARVLTEMGRTREAREVLATVQRPSLQEAKQELEARLGSATARAQP
ncbi:tetratricopeptide repeat protein [Ruficoccus sp. ZRK36]|uniref:tetratricopeptide repeat protein n=1 Tax=Ruficoccus sp. ZRK36 TaxID=2866311 RepID=UPI001C72AB0F|nr:tetratricopeptide repeat protein [Ruficoccus sp. ZRK36]QYY36964.1 tetratricopeptide repeat protein [Ruficoccus sp. ZRK36]